MLKGFASDGNEVYCITSSWGNGQFEALLSEENIPYSKMRLGFISKTFSRSAVGMTIIQAFHWPKLLVNYTKLLSRFKPDVVIHSTFHHLFMLYPVLKQQKIVNIYHSHESINTSNFYKRLFSFFDKKINLFVGVSDFVSKKLKDLGISAGKVKTIHNGLEAKNSTFQKMQNNDVFTIGIVGQVGKWKGHEDLILALEILKSTRPGSLFKLFIFGHGKSEFVEELKALIHAKNLQAFIEWKGFVNDLPDIYGDLNVLCVPTRTEEPFATSALEAGLFGIPVIVTRKGGFPEIVNQGYNGFIINPNVPEEIAAALIILIDDPALVVKMGLNHHELVARLFTYRQFINNWKNAISGTGI